MILIYFLSLPTKEWEVKSKLIMKERDIDDVNMTRNLDGITKVGLNEYIQKYANDLNAELSRLSSHYAG